MKAAAHPGEILRDDFLEPMGLSAYRLAKDIGVPLNRICAILEGKRAITADTALRLERYFGLSPGYWLRGQMLYELELAQRELGSRIAKEVRPREQAAA
jgi:addiction module HigA family antidote